MDRRTGAKVFLVASAAWKVMAIGSTTDWLVDRVPDLAAALDAITDPGASNVLLALAVVLLVGSYAVDYLQGRSEQAATVQGTHSVTRWQDIVLRVVVEDPDRRLTLEQLAEITGAPQKELKKAVEGLRRSGKVQIDGTGSVVMIGSAHLEVPDTPRDPK